LIDHSFDVGTFPSSGGALQALLGSGRLSLIRSDSLSALLAEWPTLRDNIASNAELQVLNREAEIQDYLVQAGVPISRIASTLGWLDILAEQVRLRPHHVVSCQDVRQVACRLGAGV